MIVVVGSKAGMVGEEHSPCVVAAAARGVKGEGRRGEERWARASTLSYDY
jgi:hypothetical protein